MYICPLCQSPLSPCSGGLSCFANHRFDRAKEGYINLLPVQHKGSKVPGDNLEMLTARRQFLGQGYYQPLRDRVQQLLEEKLPNIDSNKLLDLGCGEGYYTAAWRSVASRVYGIDVSKLAVKAAAKRYPGIEFSVASGYRLPIADSSLDAVIRIYAPSKAEELARVIRVGGYLLTVTPGPRHLYQFKSLIYQQVQLHPEREHPLPRFKLIERHQLAYNMQLTGDSAVNLLQMTPFAWRAQSEVWQQLADQQFYECETDFLITLWRRC